MSMLPNWRESFLKFLAENDPDGTVYVALISDTVGSDPTAGTREEIEQEITEMAETMQEKINAAMPGAVVSFGYVEFGTITSAVVSDQIIEFPKGDD